MYKLKIIIGSTRPGRKGPAIANWIENIAAQFEEFKVELVDLTEVNLPFLDEPNHPMRQTYIHQHTKDWSSIIDDADAFIFITPEYNYSFSAVLKNAIDYLHNEWMYKPVAFVSYGGQSGGMRALQALKLVISAFKMVPIRESISITFFNKYMNNDIFTGDEILNKNANVMIKELLKWTPALKSMREENLHAV